MMSNKPPKKKVALVVTSVLMVKFFLVEHIQALSEKYELTLILKNDYPEILSATKIQVRVIEIPIERKISIIKDLYVFLILAVIFYKERFHLVHTLTPKAGLLGMLAAFLVRAPIRVHTFQGEVWSTKIGIYRSLLKCMDYLVGCLATTLTVVSKTEKYFLIKEGVILDKKSTVLMNGSISGVNLDRFKYTHNHREKVRFSLGISEDQTVFIYVGRINSEKGVVELLLAFQKLQFISPKSRLLIVGVDEHSFLEQFLANKPNIRNSINIIPYSQNPEYYMVASDVIVLPSHREGFGMVIIEAAAIGIPAIGSNIYGIQDAIVLGETGLFFEKQSISDLLEKMKWMVDNPDERVLMGLKARKRVEMSFNQTDVVNAMLDFYADQFSRL
ncbi:glycosyltransferase family 4 protein [Methylophilaceae bacterium]|nr:glycosyltransferase family 4 protein [Methylophilaceae bacterium]